MPKKKFCKKRPHMFEAIFTSYLLSILALILIAAAIIAYFFYQFMLQEKGLARVEVLKQISDSNSVTRISMVNVMNMIYDDFYDALLAPADAAGDEAIAQQLQETGELLQRMDLDYTLDIQMHDKRAFTTNPNGTIQYLKYTYWYIKHYSGEIETSWNLRYLDIDDLNSYGLSYGRTVYDTDGTAVGVIILTAKQEVLFRTFQQLMKDVGTVYILDQNGIIISSSNTQRIGNWMANMAAFEQEYGYNSSAMLIRHGEHVMQSNYHDPDSGWTFIEQQDMSELLKESIGILWICMTAVLTCSLFISILVYLRIRKTTDILTDLSIQIGSKSANDLSLISIQDAYEETHTLSTAFNEMMERLQHMALDIQRREREKQKTEYDFLHAQINPHFLNNTLLAVKSLVSMGDMDRAGQIMTKLVELLHIPPTSEIQFVTLREELHLVENYISIMNCRTGKQIEFLCDVPAKLLQSQVPRMILQPMVDNSIFHGFAEKAENCRISVTAGYKGAALCITVTDNGDGMSPERMAEVSSGNYTSDRTQHGIGLKNIRQRLRIIYGGDSGLLIRSLPGETTSITIVMDHYECRQADDSLTERRDAP